MIEKKKINKSNVFRATICNQIKLQFLIKMSHKFLESIDSSGEIK